MNQTQVNKEVAKIVILTNIYCTLAGIRLALYFVGVWV